MIAGTADHALPAGLAAAILFCGWAGDYFAGILGRHTVAVEADVERRGEAGSAVEPEPGGLATLLGFGTGE